MGEFPRDKRARKLLMVCQRSQRKFCSWPCALGNSAVLAVVSIKRMVFMRTFRCLLDAAEPTSCAGSSAALESLQPDPLTALSPLGQDFLVGFLLEHSFLFLAWRSRVTHGSWLHGCYIWHPRMFPLSLGFLWPPVNLAF